MEKNVVYASDEKFAEILAVSVESLLQYNSEVTIYILNNHISQDSVEKLRRQVGKHHSEIKFIPLEELEYYTGREISCQKKISKTAYFRLFMAQILPQNVNKLIYLDCDTMVMGSLDELFAYPLIYSCGAVVEPTSKLMKKKIKMSERDDYFNSGVLLVDLKKWREGNLIERFNKAIGEMRGKIPFEDQGILNYVLKGKIDRLPIRFNVETQYFDFGYEGFQMMKKNRIRYTKKDVELAMEKPSIIHFTNSFASERPWVRGSKHQYANVWKNIRDKTEWDKSPEWKSHKDFVRKSSRWVYDRLPGEMKFHFIYWANGVVRVILM